jgi:hypothetical protein
MQLLTKLKNMDAVLQEHIRLADTAFPSARAGLSDQILQQSKHTPVDLPRGGRL